MNMKFHVQVRARLLLLFLLLLHLLVRIDCQPTDLIPATPRHRETKPPDHPHNLVADRELPDRMLLLLSLSRLP